MHKVIEGRYNNKLNSIFWYAYASTRNCIFIINLMNVSPYQMKKSQFKIKNLHFDSAIIIFSIVILNIDFKSLNTFFVWFNRDHSLYFSSNNIYIFPFLLQLKICMFLFHYFYIVSRFSILCMFWFDRSTTIIHSENVCLGATI